MRVYSPASTLNHLACLFLFMQRAFLFLVTQLIPTLCDLRDCSPPGSSDHDISQARILERVAISFSRGSS